MDKTRFGARLRMARNASGLKASEVAEIIDVATGEYYTRYERGTVTPQPDTIVQLCNLYKTTPDFLFADSLNFVGGLTDKIARLQPRDREAVEALVDTLLQSTKRAVDFECEEQRIYSPKIAEPED